MEIKTNEIKEIYKGHYFMLLDFPTIDILNYIDRENFKRLLSIRQLRFQQD